LTPKILTVEIIEDRIDNMNRKSNEEAPKNTTDTPLRIEWE